MRPPAPSVAACFAAVRHPALYRNFAIHLFVMLPAGMIMCAIASAMDQKLGWIGPFEGTAGKVLGGSCIAVGGLWVWYVYGYLYLLGEGSPGTHVDGGPIHLVDQGPYTVIRHPSVLGKVLAVIGLGILWNSTMFLLAFVPVLVLYSVVTNRLIQEHFCDLRFGERYGLYRQRVPMLVPRPSGLKRWWRGEAALPEGAAIPSIHPPNIWMEFRYYLVGLVLMILFFSVLYTLS